MPRAPGDAPDQQAAFGKLRAQVQVEAGFRRSAARAPRIHLLGASLAPVPGRPEWIREGNSPPPHRRRRRTSFDSSTAAASLPSLSMAHAASPRIPPIPRMIITGKRRRPAYALAFSLLFDLGPGVAQRHRAVEDQLAGRGIRVDAEIAQPLELVARPDGAASARLGSSLAAASAISSELGFRFAVKSWPSGTSRWDLRG